MKNKKARKTYPSKKKTSNAKIIVTILLVFVLLCGAIVGTIAAISDGFTKPVEEWFSDKATVTPGGDQGDQTGDNNQDSKPEVCNHIFEYGVCTECGKRAADVLQLATKAVDPDEDCIVNFYTDNYKLIKSISAKGGDAFVGIDAYEDYAILFPAKINVPASFVVEDSFIINGETFLLDSYFNKELTPLSALYPTAHKDYVSLNLYPTQVYAKLNGEIFYGETRNISGTSPVRLSYGDELEFIAGGSSGYYVCDGFLYLISKSSELSNLCYGLNIVNIIVMNYSEGA